MFADFKPILKNKNFRYLWISQVLSQVTINILNFVLIVKLLTETGSTIATSLLWVAYALPAILIGPIAAASVDVIDKKKVLVTTNLLQALSIFLFALLSKQSFFSLYALAFTYSFFNQFYVPAEQASLPGFVDKKNLPHANGVFFITQQASLIVGFGVAGALNHFMGFQNTLYLGSGLLFLAFLSVNLLPKMKAVVQISWSLDESIIEFFRKILEGYRYIKANRKVLLPLLILLGFSVTLAIIAVNVPVIATDILNISPNLAGVSVIVTAGIGAVAGSVIVPKLLKKKVRKKKIIERSLLIILISLFVLNFVTIILPGVSKIIVGSLSIMLAGFSFVGIIIPSQTFLQEHTSEDFRGRVFGNFWFLSNVATVLPMMFAGVLTQYLGIRTLLTIICIAPVYLFVYSKAKGDSLFDSHEKI